MTVGSALLTVLAVVILIRLAVSLSHRPQRGILLLATLVPYNGLLLVIPHPGLANGWKEALTGLTLVATFVAPASARGESGRRAPAWTWAVVALVLLGVASAAVEHDLAGVIGLKIDFFYLLVAAAAWRCPLSERERDRLVTILMVNGILTSAFGVIQQGLGADRLNALGWEYNTAIRFAGNTLRSFSTFDQPFPFALFVMMVILVCLPVALADPRRARNQLFLAATPLLLVGMASAIVRAAFLGLAVGLIYLAITRHRALLHAVALAAVGLLLVPSALLGTFLSSTSLHQRTNGWTATSGRVLAAPLGNGIGASGSAAEKTQSVASGTDATFSTRPSAPVATAATYQPDNYYFKTVLELGPIGLWLFVLMLLGAFSAARTAARTRDGPVQPFATGVAAGVLAAAAAATVATYFEIFPMDVFFWLLLGALFECRAGLPLTRSPSVPQARGFRPTSASFSAR